MKKLFKSVAVATLASSALLSGAASAADQKIAVVNFQQVMQQIPQTDALRQKLEAEFKDSRAELEQLKKDFEYYQNKKERDSELMSDKQKTDLDKQIADTYRAYQEKGQKLQQAAGAMQNQESNKILALIGQTVESIAAKEKFDLVIRREALVFVTPDADISQKVIEQVSKLEN
ncbi:OmpH family outer membrane protein [Thalassotalea sediminis]|uniref:OmpH family outer membrane protein n=1 Tax=Thalassotalea sediminis TaxID=1759089 RepID=UPI002573F2E3|nr:OmpH family outer membrane protein [Thalassotalea sediminis]